MPNNNFKRQAEGKASIPQFAIEDWVDLPVSIMFKFPDLREWNEQMKQRFQSMQIKLAERDRLEQIT